MLKDRNLRIKLTILLFLTTIVSFGQMGANACVFKIYYNGRILTDKDSLNFKFYIENPFLKKLMYKWEGASFPDSCWVLYTQGGLDPEIIHDPELIIVNKSSSDTMRIYYSYMVYPFVEGTDIPIVNTIAFNSGKFEVNKQITLKDWEKIERSRKIKRIENITPKTKSKWQNTKAHSNPNGLNISYSNQIHSALEIGYTKYLKSIVKSKVNGSISGYDKYEDYTFAYWNISASVDLLLTKNFIFGPRLSSNFTYSYFSSQLNVTAYSDSKTIHPVITPEIGIGKFIGIRYGYNFKLDKDTYNEIGNHKITVFINLKFDFPSLRHVM